jgi:hypothetical protein
MKHASISLLFWAIVLSLLGVAFASPLMDEDALANNMANIEGG